MQHNNFFGIDEKYYLMIFFIILFLFHFPPPQNGLIYCKIQFLQSYSDGIYFRSLFGSIYSLLINNYNTEYVYITYMVILICNFMFLHYFLNKIVVKKYSLNSKEFLLYCVIMLSPMGIMRYYDAGQLFRFDSILVFLYLITILSILYSKKYYLWGYLLITVIAILIHEVYFFIFLPILFLIICSDIILHKKSKSFVAVFIVFNLSFMLLVMYIKIMHNVSTTEFLENYKIRTNRFDDYETALNVLYPDLKLIYDSNLIDNINHALSWLIRPNGIITFIVCYSCLLPMVWIIYKSLIKINFINILLVITPLIITIYMCFLGTDIVRWFSMASLSYLGILAYLMKNKMIDIKYSALNMITLLIIYLSIGTFGGWTISKNLLDYLELIQKGIQH